MNQLINDEALRRVNEKQEESENRLAAAERKGQVVRTGKDYMVNLLREKWMERHEREGQKKTIDASRS